MAEATTTTEPIEATSNVEANVGATEPAQTGQVFGTVGDVNKPDQVITAENTQVQELMGQGLTEEAAIGTVVGQQEKQSPAMIDSSAGRDLTAKNQEDLANIEAAKTTDLTTTTETAPKTQAVEGEVLDAETAAQLSAVDAESARYDEEYNSYIKGLDDDAAAQIKSIQAQYQRLRDDMAVKNRAIQGAITTAGFRSGRARYAPEIQAGIVGAEIKAGQARISALIQEEQDLIREAKSAARSGRWQAFNDYMSQVRSSRQEKNAIIQQHKDNVFKAIQEERQIMQNNIDNFYKQQDYLQKQQDRMMPGIAASLVNFDNDLNVVAPSMDQINEVAQQYGIEPAVLMGVIDSKVNEMNSISREERRFTLDQQLGQLNIEAKQLENKYNAAILPLNIQSKILDIETGEVSLDRLKFLSDKERQMLPFELQMAALNVEALGLSNDGKVIANDKMQLELDEAIKEAQNADINDGSLDIEDITKINKIPQVKNLESLRNLKVTMTNYKNLVEKYGTAKISPTQKNLLNAAHAEALIAWKEAAKLGALTGPDIMLAEQAIPRAAPSKDAGILGTVFGPTLNAPILKALEQSIGVANDQAAREIKTISEIEGGKYYNTSTFQSMIGAFSGEFKPTVTKNHSLFQQTASPEEYDTFVQYLQDSGVNEMNEDDVNEAFEIYQGRTGGGGGSDVSTIKDFDYVTTSIGKGTATGIESGSSAWKWGYDFVLDGGRGAKLTSPFSGTIIKVINAFSNKTGKPLSRTIGKKQNSGFGNQVKVRLSDGSEVWFSHLDSVANLREGSRISKGDFLGKQGNTGITLGRTGVHLDITGKKPDGSYYTSKEVASLLNTRRV